MLLSLLAGCSIAPKRSTHVSMLPAPTPVADSATFTQKLTRVLFEQYQSWRGTRYQSGGLSKKGVDCSGYVYLTFKERLGRDVPRSTTALVQAGAPIDKTQLQTGDLVFFNTGRNQHVGIYLNDGQFMHASTRKGVMISHLNNSYWSKRWWTARRIEPDYLFLLATR